LFIIHSHAGAGLGQRLVYIGQYRYPMLFFPFLRREQSLRSPLKVAIVPTFKGIVVQVRIFELKRAKKAFSAIKLLLGTAFLLFSGISNTFGIDC
jgi:hypothetical protein